MLRTTKEMYKFFFAKHKNEKKNIVFCNFRRKFLQRIEQSQRLQMMDLMQLREKNTSIEQWSYV